jgi:hypothetical protein
VKLNLSLVLSWRLDNLKEADLTTINTVTKVLKSTLNIASCDSTEALSSSTHLERELYDDLRECVSESLSLGLLLDSLGYNRAKLVLKSSLVLRGGLDSNAPRDKEIAGEASLDLNRITYITEREKIFS